MSDLLKNGAAAVASVETQIQGQTIAPPPPAVMTTLAAGAGKAVQAFRASTGAAEVAEGATAVGEATIGGTLLETGATLAAGVAATALAPEVLVGAAVVGTGALAYEGYKHRGAIAHSATALLSGLGFGNNSSSTDLSQTGDSPTVSHKMETLKGVQFPTRAETRTLGASSQSQGQSRKNALALSV